MVHGELPDSEAVAVDPRNVLPPEALLHGAKFAGLVHHLFPRQPVGAAWIVNGHTVEKSVNEVERTRHCFAHPIVGPIHAPPKDNIGLIANRPKRGKVLGMALAVRIETKQKRRFQNFHGVANGARVAFARVAKKEIHRDRLRQLGRHVSDQQRDSAAIRLSLVL